MVQVNLHFLCGFGGFALWAWPRAPLRNERVHLVLPSECVFDTRVTACLNGFGAELGARHFAALPSATTHTSEHRLVFLFLRRSSDLRFAASSALARKENQM